MIRTACVTGADRGVGLSIVRELLFMGTYVFAGKYNGELSLLDKLGEEFPETLHILELDVGSEDSVNEVKKIICEHTDQLDVLINNAAILGNIQATVLDPIDLKEIQDVFNINTLGPLRMSQALLPLLLNGERKLIANISSEAGSIETCDRTSWFAYCMSKSALNMESQLIHNGIKDVGGQVLAIHPGWVQTYMQGQLDENALLTADESARHIVQLLLRSDQFKGEHAVFLDYSGQLLSW
ncbi:SDR family oxidoreductase [Paenibacillus macquariensis]|uniref:NAD(P)-dependent dehydrogenase, short-chain alcohol dehydrogenase family n=1 Tax=Paenibacillus macquariensis TaxID=948756 RepID=A0ABY1K9Q7_9BACL|nr:SDR family oxidoreductase [Paenibacillus macquariensis]MEC0092437.1 SDR family oxidoreductase [Paenibacillus macquariensis]SIR47400.1 NAD(P)-dependent dehydrogenase, short-chain alcohol dehydrogenase family [Paenibacillus macquariensis]